MYRFILIALFLISVTVYGQSKKTINKERYVFITDSLSAEKDKLLKEKETLISEIDSLKNLLTKLNEEWKSSRESQLIKKYGRRIGKRIYQAKIWKGMSEKMLEESWGKPDKITKNKEKWGTFTQWYYGEITYFFKNGIMTDWEEKK